MISLGFKLLFMELANTWLSIIRHNYPLNHRKQYGLLHICMNDGGNYLNPIENEESPFQGL